MNRIILNNIENKRSSRQERIRRRRRAAFLIEGLLGGLLLVGNFSSVWGAEGVQVWPVDIHEKIFADTYPACDNASDNVSDPVSSAKLILRGARNEYESGQIGFLASEDTPPLTLSASPLIRGDGQAQIDAAQIRLRPIRTLPITKNTQKSEKVIPRPAPADYPDILTEETAITLTAGKSQGVWVTLFIPEGTPAGDYSGTITASSDNVKAEIPIQLEVFPWTLPSERHLWVTNWFSLEKIADAHGVPLYSEEFWPILERYFRNMADHRQNVILAPWLPDGQFVKAARRADGEWEIDFSLLDRFLTLAEKCGVAERIEFQHCAINDRVSACQFLNASVFDEKAGKNVNLPADEWLNPVLGRLEAWLRETGRLDRSMIHVADEPFLKEVESWRIASAKVHAAAPHIKRIEAIETLHFADALEIWVPKLTHYDRWKKEYDRAGSLGAEVWFYTCCSPIGNNFPNRFIDFPGTRVRALHWVNYEEGLSGYLHWGYNIWKNDPFGPPIEKYGPGNTHIVYPGPLDSIRWEIERESIEDFEYFVLLESLWEKAKTGAQEKTSADLWWFDSKSRSLELSRRVVRSATDIELDPKAFEDARLEAAREISAFEEGFPLIVRSFPEDRSPLLDVSIISEFYGLTLPGAKVTVNGEPVPVAEDGTFSFSNDQPDIRQFVFTATLGEKKVSTIRSFTVTDAR